MGKQSRKDLMREIMQRIEAGESQTSIATALGITRAQLRYRLRVLKERKEREGACEVAVTTPRTFSQEEAAPGLDDGLDETGGCGQSDTRARRTQQLNLYDDSWNRFGHVNRLQLMVKEPTTLFCYWEVDEVRKSLVTRHFQCVWNELPFFIQLYDVTDLEFSGYNAHSVRQIEVSPNSEQWYITGVEPRRRYLVDFGTLTINRVFFSILRSNIVETPPDRVFRDGGSDVQFHTFSPPKADVPTRPSLGQSGTSPSRTKISKAEPSVPYQHAFDGYSATDDRRGD